MFVKITLVVKLIVGLLPKYLESSESLMYREIDSRCPMKVSHSFSGKKTYANECHYRSGLGAYAEVNVEWDSGYLTDRLLLCYLHIFRFSPYPSYTIRVNIDDTLRVVCPNKDADKRYLKVFKVSGLSFTDCLLETDKTLVMSCDDSSTPEKPTLIGVRRFSPMPSPDALLFEPGETYYWICKPTSRGDELGINNSQFGMCQADNMRMTIIVGNGLVTAPTSTIPSVNPKFSAIAQPSVPRRREQQIPDGFTPKQFQRVVALAEKGATGTFTYTAPAEADRKQAVQETSRDTWWDTLPIYTDVLNGASENILLGTNRIGDEEGSFIVHEDVVRSYEYQSNTSVSRLLFALVPVILFFQF
uniref:Ephrin RBD domain-containing protein n=1 Tax=Heterorhabditis bacteriophora TaxID=37862 RepID=A0A1I7XRT3_HETBA